jgi:hypothetical protein
MMASRSWSGCAGASTADVVTTGKRYGVVLYVPFMEMVAKVATVDR